MINPIINQPARQATDLESTRFHAEETMQQFNFFGPPAIAGDVKDRVHHILKTHPDARNDYKALMFWYWYEFDGLWEVLGDLPSMRDAFRAWFTSKATSPKTLQNRAMEIQREDPDLDANATVRDWRDRQAKIGVVK